MARRRGSRGAVVMPEGVTPPKRFYDYPEGVQRFMLDYTEGICGITSECAPGEPAPACTTQQSKCVNDTLHGTRVYRIGDRFIGGIREAFGIAGEEGANCPPGLSGSDGRCSTAPVLAVVGVGYDEGLNTGDYTVAQDALTHMLSDYDAMRRNLREKLRENASLERAPFGQEGMDVPPALPQPPETNRGRAEPATCEYPDSDDIDFGMRSVTVDLDWIVYWSSLVNSGETMQARVGAQQLAYDAAGLALALEARELDQNIEEETEYSRNASFGDSSRKHRRHRRHALPAPPVRPAPPRPQVEEYPEYEYMGRGRGSRTYPYRFSQQRY
jgi:hypothetical protein